MPAIMLTDALLRSAEPGEKLTELWDTRVSGLCLRISPGGVRTWTFRYRPKDSMSFKRLSLGRYPEVSLSLARQRAQEKRVEVAGGADPQGARKAKREAERGALSFDALADAYIERYAKMQKKSWGNDSLYLRVHVRPVWGSRPAARIGRADAAELLDTIAKAAPTSANRTQSILSRVFNWAIESGLLEVNPVGRMPKRARETAKDRILTSEEFRVLWQTIGDGPANESVTAALRFLLLTGLRPGEVAGVAIAELADVENGARARLDIPADRMKAGRAHIVPLAPMALAVVRAQLEQVVDGQEHLFPSAFADRGPIARHSLSQGLRRIIAGLPASRATERLKSDPPTPHDFRRTLATGLAALGIPREDRLAVLAHAQGDVHAIHYDKYDRLAEKRRALEAWEGHVAAIITPTLAKTADNVVKLGGARR
jgi:integrase